jgi:uncharacterized membrane protein YbhN (UPF0104 family)
MSGGIIIDRIFSFGYPILLGGIICKSNTVVL